MKGLTKQKLRHISSTSIFVNSPMHLMNSMHSFTHQVPGMHLIQNWLRFCLPRNIQLCISFAKKLRTYVLFRMLGFYLFCQLWSFVLNVVKRMRSSFFNNNFVFYSHQELELEVNGSRGLNLPYCLREMTVDETRRLPSYIDLTDPKWDNDPRVQKHKNDKTYIGYETDASVHSCTDHAATEHADAT